MLKLNFSVQDILKKPKTVCPQQHKTLQNVSTCFFKYVDNKWEQSSPSAGCDVNIVQPDVEMKVLSWNVWNSEYNRSYRMKALLERIDSLDADIVTLVDITPPVYEIIKNSKLVQSKYLISPENNVVIMSKFTVKSAALVQLPWTEHRAISAEIPWKLQGIDGEDGEYSINVIGAHLIADDFDYKWRRDQLDYLQSQTNDMPTLITGDFNLRWKKEDHFFENLGFVDIWKHLKVDQPGYTTCDDTRSDRMIMRKMRDWHPVNIELVNNREKPECNLSQIVSNHQGLLMTLKRYY